MYEPSFIFNLNYLAHQTHLCSTYSLDLLEKLHFEAMRLGKIRDQILEAEPVLRSANMMSMDLAAVRLSDSPGNKQATVNGLFAEEFCQLARYAGISDSVDSFGIYGCNLEEDVRDQTTQLAAQACWYFMDGFYNRKPDVPDETNNEYMKYSIQFKDNLYEMIFWRSIKTNRWWMEVTPQQQGRRQPKGVLIPCSYFDYQTASRDEVPERWLKALQKLS
jgi:hypothetical protein